MSRKKKETRREEARVLDKSMLFLDGGYAARLDDYRNTTEISDNDIQAKLVRIGDAIVEAETHELVIREIGNELAGLITKKAYLEKYTASDKIIALTILEYSATANEDGNFEPNTKTCSAALGIPEKFLTEWWKDREVILEAASQQLVRIPDMISTKLKFLSMQLLEELERRPLAALSNSEIIKLLGDTIKLDRLLSGKSTANVAVNLMPGIDGHVKKR